MSKHHDRVGKEACDRDAKLRLRDLGRHLLLSLLSLASHESQGEICRRFPEQPTPSPSGVPS